MVHWRLCLTNKQNEIKAPHYCDNMTVQQEVTGKEFHLWASGFLHFHFCNDVKSVNQFEVQLPAIISFLTIPGVNAGLSLRACYGKGL